MPVCANFNYRRVNLSANGSGASTSCGTPNQSAVQLVGAGFTPEPFTALCVQRFSGGLDLGPGITAPVNYRAETSGTTTGWPYATRALAIPGAAGAEGVGMYIVFGQVP